MMTVDGITVPVSVSGPDNAPVVVLLGDAGHSVAAYDAVCARLHIASLRTVVIGADDRLSVPTVLGVLDKLQVRWAVVVGDRSGAGLAWELAARRLDRVTGLVVVDRGHPRVVDPAADCPAVEVNTTVLVSNATARTAARGSQRYVYGDCRVVDMPARRNAAESTAQLAGEIVLRTSTW
jgi:pimeloyl-ACP methyl ester carboxylesterase